MRNSHVCSTVHFPQEGVLPTRLLQILPVLGVENHEWQFVFEWQGQIQKPPCKCSSSVDWRWATKTSLNGSSRWTCWITCGALVSSQTATLTRWQSMLHLWLEKLVWPAACCRSVLVESVKSKRGRREGDGQDDTLRHCTTIHDIPWKPIPPKFGGGSRLIP